MTRSVFWVSIISHAFLKANLFHPLLGSGIKKLPRRNLVIWLINPFSSSTAKPAEGIFDLSFL
jgi:hypothetical protein